MLGASSGLAAIGAASDSTHRHRSTSRNRLPTDLANHPSCEPPTATRDSASEARASVRPPRAASPAAASVTPPTLSAYRLLADALLPAAPIRCLSRVSVLSTGAPPPHVPAPCCLSGSYTARQTATNPRPAPVRQPHQPHARQCRRARAPSHGVSRPRPSISA